MESEIKNSIDFSFIRYSIVWEDLHALQNTLQVNTTDRVLCITSAGDNVLGLLLYQPAELHAIDINPAQNALLRLKQEAITRLGYNEFSILAGLQQGNRSRLVGKLFPEQDHSEQQQWLENDLLMDKGFIFLGKLERYLAAFQRQYITHDVLVRDLLHAEKEQTRTGLFGQLMQPLKRQFQNYFNNDNMGNRGRDPRMLKYVQVNTGDHFFNKLQQKCAARQLLNNPFVTYFLNGNFTRDALPPYLQPENFNQLKKSVHLIKTIDSDLESYLTSVEAGQYTKASLSNIFEYVSQQHTAETQIGRAHV
jgi:S-adenosylmethionine-diacylglycerol 3-amino-3-carboxypropyl transferase